MPADKTKKQNSSSYPEVITHLPEAEFPIKGGRAWISQSETHQIVFFEFAASLNLPKHSHNYPQWGIVIEGKMELTVDGKSTVYQKGDEYLVSIGAVHCARFLEKSRVMDFFSEKSRYKSKSSSI
ncbi:MAG TPA: cupin domain-containing protein [Candidatus Nanoarchaeia archaeon]|nr:cupin domain-containing protein [Candidatus Nanoarchaeia archaeon]